MQSWISDSQCRVDSRDKHLDQIIYWQIIFFKMSPTLYFHSFTEWYTTFIDIQNFTSVISMIFKFYSICS